MGSGRGYQCCDPFFYIKNSKFVVKAIMLPNPPVDGTVSKNQNQLFSDELRQIMIWRSSFLLLIYFCSYFA